MFLEYTKQFSRNATKQSHVTTQRKTGLIKKSFFLNSSSTRITSWQFNTKVIGCVLKEHLVEDKK